jgi:AcrR family transcriptional regulator
MGRKQMGDTRRRQILEGLLKAVGEHGLQRCNMTNVAEAAGVSRGILHYYFKNKDEMIGALVAHLKESYLPDFRDQTSQIEGPQEQLNKSLWYPVQTFGQGGAALAKVWIEFWGLAAHHPEVHQFILDGQQALRAHFVEILKAGIDQGVFSDDIRQPGELLIRWRDEGSRTASGKRPETLSPTPATTWSCRGPRPQKSSRPRCGSPRSGRNARA